MSFRDWLKQFVPMSSRSLNSRIDHMIDHQEKTSGDLAKLQSEMRKEINTLGKNLNKETGQHVDSIEAAINTIAQRIDAIEKRLSGIENPLKTADGRMKKIEQRCAGIEELLKKTDNRITVLQNKISSLESTSAQIRRISRENNWADVYNSTIEGTNWLKSRSFSPGRWAIGYQYLYVLYRILNEVHPKNIIDLGLGQSSWMIAQYAASDETVSHTIVEHDQTWIDGFLKDHALPDNSKIVRLNFGTKQYKEAAVRVYDGFAETFRDRKFDLISIDGPLGGDMPDYARIDVLGMLPGILSENFIILFDDTERSGEKHTVQEMERILSENEIKYAKGIYSGAKDMTIICAEDLHFLTTM